MRMKTPLVILRTGIVGTMATACVGLFAPAASAQNVQKCGRGVEVRLRMPGTSRKAGTRQAKQGSLLVVEVRSAAALAELNAEWSGKEVAFWKEDGASEASRGEIRRALIGVDLEKPAGEYGLKLEAQPEGGEKVSCAAAIVVRAGHFAVERLSVAPKYVEPSPEDLARAEKERQKLRAIFATVTPERLWQGSFRLPLDGEHAGSNFGRRRVLNGQPGSPHSGADFPAPAGTPVHAAQSGRVALAEELYFSGNTVVIDHGLGVYTFYGHLEKIDVAAGDAVGSGGVIGLVGGTGRATGPHLHWGLTVEGARVNPVEIVRVTP